MKKTMLFGTICTLAGCFIINIASAQKSDEAAIKKVLDEETSNYFHKNYEGWANTWAHDSANYVVRTDASGQSKLIGWSAVSNEYKQAIEKLGNADDASIAPFLNKNDFRFYINGNMATVSFNEGGILSSFETCTLIKQNDVWKILNFTRIGNNSYEMADIMNFLKSFMGDNWMVK